MVYHNYSDYKHCARELRKNATNSEQIVWEVLRNRRYRRLKFRRQYIFCGFIIDFYCVKYSLAIEIDGKIHEKKKEYDQIRTECLINAGMTVIRISSDEIEKDVGILFSLIDKNIPPSPILSSLDSPGEGG